MEIFENIINIISHIFERYLVPTLISVLFTIVFKYITPNDFKIIKKIGESWYLVGIFIFVFLLVLLIEFVYKKFSSRISDLKYENKKKQQILEKNIISMRNFVDGLNPSSKDVINYFLENENKPLAYYDSFPDYSLNSDSFLLNINQTQYRVKSSKEKFKSVLNLNDISFPKGITITLYKLPNEMYDLLMYMKENNIPISNFEDNKK